MQGGPGNFVSFSLHCNKRGRGTTQHNYYDHASHDCFHGDQKFSVADFSTEHWKKVFWHHKPDDCCWKRPGAGIDAKKARQLELSLVLKGCKSGPVTRSLHHLWQSSLVDQLLWRCCCYPLGILSQEYVGCATLCRKTENMGVCFFKHCKGCSMEQVDMVIYMTLYRQPLMEVGNSADSMHWGDDPPPPHIFLGLLSWLGVVQSMFWCDVEETGQPVIGCIGSDWLP